MKFAVPESDSFTVTLKKSHVDNKGRGVVSNFWTQIFQTNKSCTYFFKYIDQFYFMIHSIARFIVISSTNIGLMVQ